MVVAVKGFLKRWYHCSAPSVLGLFVVVVVVAAVVVVVLVVAAVD